MKKLILNILCFWSVLSGWAQAVFVENKGQWPESVVARAGIPNGALWAETHSFLYQFHDSEFESYLHPGPLKPPPDYRYRSHAFRVDFEGASPDVWAANESFLPQYYNFYLGNDTSKWRSRAAASRRVHYHNLYPGIDLHLYSKTSTVKYDFIVRPGADPAQIVMNYEGGEGFEVRLVDGALRMHTSVNELIEQKPFAYQLIGTRLVEVPCNFVLRNGKVHFDVGEYDPEY
ncbi:MAG: hypothetical protein JNM00_16115, partial [Flavobacteriales bacterium]|nr:hypothetical protein [Flavobacteriales bacterium]